MSTYDRTVMRVAEDLMTDIARLVCEEKRKKALQSIGFDVVALLDSVRLAVTEDSNVWPEYDLWREHGEEEYLAIDGYIHEAQLEQEKRAANSPSFGVVKIMSHWPSGDTGGLASMMHARAEENTKEISA